MAAWSWRLAIVALRGFRFVAHSLSLPLSKLRYSYVICTRNARGISPDRKKTANGDSEKRTDSPNSPRENKYPQQPQRFFPRIPVRFFAAIDNAPEIPPLLNSPPCVLVSSRFAKRFLRAGKTSPASSTSPLQPAPPRSPRPDARVQGPTPQPGRTCRTRGRIAELPPYVRLPGEGHKGPLRRGRGGGLPTVRMPVIRRSPLGRGRSTARRPRSTPLRSGLAPTVRTLLTPTCQQKYAPWQRQGFERWTYRRPTLQEIAGLQKKRLWLLGFSGISTGALDLTSSFTHISRRLAITLAGTLAG